LEVFAGYQVNKYFGVEGGYANLGEYNVNSSVSAPVAAVGTSTWEANNVWSLSALGYVPIQEHFSAFGRLGLAYSRLSFNYSDTAGDAINASKNATSPLFGLGLKYDLTKNASVRGEFERYENIGDGATTGQSSVNVWSVGLQYHF
jgi:OOP family OmpA-OmpF porin